MSTKFQVTIFKKSKKAPYPDHIVVKGFPSTRDPYNNTAHLYFDKGVLAKFVHMQDAPKGKRVWDPESERYVDLEPKHRIVQEFTLKNGKTTYSKGPIHTAGDFFVIFGYLYPDMHTITFCQGSPLQIHYYKITTDLKGKWRNPDDLTKWFNDKDAQIKEIYTRKGGKTCPRWQDLKKNERD